MPGMNLAELNSRLASLANAFGLDGYTVTRAMTVAGRIGMAAEHKTAINYDTGRHKKAFYVEGGPYEMGYLLGLLAEDDVSAMAVDFADEVVFAFIGARAPGRYKELGEILVRLIYDLSKKTYAELPPEIREEIRGLLDGCKDANPRTRADLAHLCALNTGIDLLCALAYTGDFLLERIPTLHHAELKTPLACNAFAVFGRPAGDGHYLGRDFMFPTAGVYQDRAAMIVYNPTGKRDRPARPLVSMSAPGLVGSIAAMNVDGLGMGVDMSPAANCNPHRIGVNSLLLTRMTTQNCGNALDAVEYIRRTPRGVSWNYIVADGGRDLACVVEAGRSDTADFLSFPPEDLRPFLPDADFLAAHRSAPFQDGLMVRWSDYRYPEEYLDFNASLWQEFNSRRKRRQPAMLRSESMARKGFINQRRTDHNCPSAFYFAPQRENDDQLVITTNFYIVPEMRLYAMYPWTAGLVGDQVDDLQWRYDELNAQIHDHLEKTGPIGREDARRLIDFLAPYGRHPDYYARNARSKDGKEIRIEGSTTLMDLKGITMESHYGYYCDAWTRITLRNYLVERGSMGNPA